MVDHREAGPAAAGRVGDVLDEVGGLWDKDILRQLPNWDKAEETEGARPGELLDAVNRAQGANPGGKTLSKKILLEVLSKMVDKGLVLRLEVKAVVPRKTLYWRTAAGVEAVALADAPVDAVLRAVIEHVAQGPGWPFSEAVPGHASLSFPAWEEAGAEGEPWDSPVRLCMLTGGRARPSLALIGPETPLAATGRPLPRSASTEQHHLLLACRQQQRTPAEAAALLRLPASVVILLAADLAKAGFLTAREGPGDRLPGKTSLATPQAALLLPPGESQEFSRTEGSST